jgi:hypothetical protein
VENERHVAQLEVLDQRAKILGLGRRLVGKVPWLVREPEAQAIGSDTAEGGLERLDEVSPAERPIGRAVHEDEGPALPLVHVVHAPGGQIQPA